MHRDKTLRTTAGEGPASRALRLFTALLLVLGTCLGFGLTQTGTAIADDDDGIIEYIDRDYLFERTQLNLNTQNAIVESVEVINPNGTTIKQVEGRVAGGWGESARIDDAQSARTFRIPVPVTTWGDENGLISSEEGQALLDGVGFTVVWDNAGDYKGVPIKMKIAISDLIDAPAHQRNNNNPWIFGICVDECSSNGTEFWGDSDGYGYEVIMDAKTDCVIRGAQSARLDIDFIYEDGTPVLLDAGERLYTTVGQLDGDYLGVEGVRFLEAPEKLLLSTTTVMKRGSITNTSGFQENTKGWSPTLNGEGYLNSAETPVFYGTTPDGNIDASLLEQYQSFDHSGTTDSGWVDYSAAMLSAYSNWIDAGVIFTGDSSQVHAASTSLEIIDQVGEICYPLAFYALTALEPPAPVKTVDKENAEVGDTLTYTVTQKVNEAGIDCENGYSYSAFDFSDTLDTSLTFSDLIVRNDGIDVTDKGTIEVDGQTVSFSFDKDYLEEGLGYRGQDVTFTLTADITSYPESGIVPNEAQTIFNNRYTLDTNRVETILEIPGAPIVSTVKSSDPAPDTTVHTGDTVTYLLDTTNTGNADAPWVQLRDYIPTGTSYVEGSVSDGGVFVPSEESGDGRAYVEWVRDDLTIGATVRSQFQVTVNDDAADHIENIALTECPPTQLVPGSADNPSPATPTNQVSHPLKTEDVTPTPTPTGPGKSSMAKTGDDPHLLPLLALTAAGFCLIGAAILGLRMKKRGQH